jgi:hypothetical protein
MGKRLISAAERDRIKCSFYDQFYQANKTNLRLVNEQGKPRTDYWVAAEEYVGLKMREWEYRKDARTQTLQMVILADFEDPSGQTDIF